MRKKIASVVAGLVAAATFGPLSSTASATHDCYGVVSFAKGHVCVVRLDAPEAQVVPGPAVLVPAICAGPLGCTEEQFLRLPDFLVYGYTIVLFYDGVCYYVQDGDFWDEPAATSHDCP